MDCVESIYGKYAALTDDLRNSNYLMSLPPLPVSCVDLDGDASTMPVIYEDIYKDDDMPAYIDSQQPTKRRHSFSKIILRPFFSIKASPSFGLLYTQCGNFMIFLSFRFHVKLILENLEVVKLPFVPF